MVWPFQPKETPKQAARRHGRAIERAKRDITRERGRMANDERKIQTEIKNLAKKGQMPALRIAAKNLVRNRQQQNKMMTIEANLTSIHMRITSTGATMAMAEAMHGVTKAMRTMNKQMNIPQMQKTLMEFEKQTEIMEMKHEMMDDCMDDAMDDGTTEEQTDHEVNKVLSELGLGTLDEVSNMAGVPQHNPQAAQSSGLNTGPQAVPIGAGADPGGHGNSNTIEEDDIMRRLNDLKGGGNDGP